MYFVAAAVLAAGISAYFFAKKAGLIGGPRAIQLTPEYVDYTLIEKVRLLFLWPHILVYIRIPRHFFMCLLALFPPSCSSSLSKPVFP